MTGRRIVAGLVVLALATMGAACANDPNTDTPFVHRCAGQHSRLLCLHGVPVRLMSGVMEGVRPIAAEVALAHALRRNTIEVINFQTRHRDLSDATSEATWRRVDQLLAQAAAAEPSLRVILNLSEFAKDLVVANRNPLTALPTWYAYLDFIANRRNTVNGVVYKRDPTIAKVAIWGEPCFVGQDDGEGSDCPGSITNAPDYNTANIRTFYARVMDHWHEVAPSTLVSTGGLSHLNGNDNPAGVMNGIPWRDLMALPNNATCDVEINSNDDYDHSVRKVTNFCNLIGKGWFLAAWSSCYRSPDYPWRPVMQDDADLAAHNQLMFDTMHALDGTPAGYPAVGTSFWSMAPFPSANGVPEPGHCTQDATTFPKAAQVIRNNAW